MKQTILTCPSCNTPAIEEDKSFCKTCLNTQSMGNRWFSWKDYETGEEM